MHVQRVAALRSSPLELDDPVHGMVGDTDSVLLTHTDSRRAACKAQVVPHVSQGCCPKLDGCSVVVHFQVIIGH